MYWSTVLEYCTGIFCWSTEVLEYWSTGILEYCAGALCWSTVLEYCNVLEYCTVLEFCAG